MNLTAQQRQQIAARAATLASTIPAKLVLKDQPWRYCSVCEQSYKPNEKPRQHEWWHIKRMIYRGVGEYNSAPLNWEMINLGAVSERLR